MSDDPYVYPGTRVLKNKLSLESQDSLFLAEQYYVGQRLIEGTPAGNFDLKHLKAIHRHLFQDLYEWAGQIRTINLSKDGDSFLDYRRIEAGIAYVHRRLAADDYLKDTASTLFAGKAATLIGDINHAHPFREGNGRTQLAYLELLAIGAGHRIDLEKFRRDSWIAASQAANYGRYEHMAACIEAALIARPQRRGRSKKQTR